MNSLSCLPGAPSPWGPILDSEFRIPCPPGTCNPGRINAWAGFPPCATGGHEEPRKAHQTRRCPHYRIVWGEEWDDYSPSRPKCSTRNDGGTSLKIAHMTQVSDIWQ